MAAGDRVRLWLTRGSYLYGTVKAVSSEGLVLETKDGEEVLVWGEELNGIYEWK